MFELLTWFGAVVVIVTALVGVYSVMVDLCSGKAGCRAFLIPAGCFVQTMSNGRHRHYLVYLDGIHQSEENRRVERISGLFDDAIAAARSW